ncbi:MAG: DUF2158 domain-containing protein [archaeon]
MSDSKDFKFGDVVVLNSGGPDMNVIRENGNFCTCEWFDGTKRMEHDFNKLTLTLLKRAE